MRIVWQLTNACLPSSKAQLVWANRTASVIKFVWWEFGSLHSCFAATVNWPFWLEANHWRRHVRHEDLSITTGTAIDEWHVSNFGAFNLSAWTTTARTAARTNAARRFATWAIKGPRIITGGIL
jgi:hypothetical protein